MEAYEDAIFCKAGNNLYPETKYIETIGRKLTRVFARTRNKIAIIINKKPNISIMYLGITEINWILAIEVAISLLDLLNKSKKNFFVSNNIVSLMFAKVSETIFCLTLEFLLIK